MTLWEGPPHLLFFLLLSPAFWFYLVFPIPPPPVCLPAAPPLPPPPSPPCYPACWKQNIPTMKMTNCQSEGMGYWFYWVSSTMDIHLSTANQGFKSGSWHTKDVFCGPCLAPAAKPLRNLRELNVSGSFCLQVGQAWKGPCAGRARDTEQHSWASMLPSWPSVLPPYLGTAVDWGCAGNFQYSPIIVERKRKDFLWMARGLRRCNA